MKRPVAVGVLTAVAIAVVAGFAAGRHSGRPRFDPHAAGTLPNGALRRILRATQTEAQASSAAALAEEGRRLFHSTAVAQHGLSCATCHPAGGTNPELGTQLHPTKPGDFTGARDPISLFGVGKTAPYTWAGNVQTLPEMTVRVITNFFKDGATQPQTVTAHETAALVAYLQTLSPPVSAFDLGTMSPAALHGEKLFRGKAGCVGCHNGPLFTDRHVHNTGVPKAAGDTDPGSPLEPGAFDTPMLRDLVGSAPYMHNGSLVTLKDVVEFYNNASSLGPLHLTAADVDDIVAYLEAL